MKAHIVFAFVREFRFYTVMLCCFSSDRNILKYCSFAILLALVFFRNAKLVFEFISRESRHHKVQCLITPLHCDTNFVPSEKEGRLILKDKCSLLRLSVDAFETGRGGVNGETN